MSTSPANPVMDNPETNKGTAFTLEERKRHHLEGWLPPSEVDSMGTVKGARRHLLRRPDR